MAEKKEIKKEKRICSKKTRHIIKGLVATAVLAMMAYGLVYAPMKQLDIAQGNLYINNQAIQLAEVKDIKKCQSVAQQQLVIALESAKKEKKEVSEEDKTKYTNNIYLNCLSFEGRDYIVKAAEEEAKKADAKKAMEVKKTEDKK